MHKNSLKINKKDMDVMILFWVVAVNNVVLAVVEGFFI